MEDRRTDADLIAESLRDPARFEVIFDRHYDAIHRYLARRGGWQLADDLTMTVFLKALEGRSRFRASRDSAAPWLYGIASNVFRRHARTEVRRLRATSRLPQAAPEGLDVAGLTDRVDAEALAPRVYEAAALLSEPERTALLLVAWADLTYEEVAVATNVPIGTVRSRLNRARTRLRELLDASGQEPGVRTIRHAETANDG